MQQTILRPFQEKLDRDVDAAWEDGHTNVMPVSATGTGKTVVISHKMNKFPGSSVAIAHRQELVGQMSTALARNGVRHRLVGAKKGSALTRVISALHTAEFGYSYLDPNARAGVGGVDTVIKLDPKESFFDQVGFLTIDEGHHVLKTNKWGKCVAMFRNAKGMFPTATPLRADRKGLGRHADGLVDVMVEAPSMRDVINMGYLTDYRVICPPIQGLDLTNVPVGDSGEFVNEALRKAVHQSSIVGDVVTAYKTYALGKLGVVFAVDVEDAVKMAAEFRRQGVPAEVVSAKTPDMLRAQILRRFKNREIHVLVNVDLFGEGFDLPAIEVVQFARPTMSFALYCQQWGRALRLMIEPALHKIWGTLTDSQRLSYIAASEKPVALIIDHVQNICRHMGPPDKHRVWSLDRGDRQSRGPSDSVPYTICLGPGCYKPYPRTLTTCPHCGLYREPASRSAPEYVDGDLFELDAQTLALLRGQIAKVDRGFYAPKGMSHEAQIAARRHHMARQDAQFWLRNSIAWWAGLWHAQGESERESYRRFWFKFGIDVASAQGLGRPEAEELTKRINLELSRYGIDGSVNSASYFANDQ